MAINVTFTYAYVEQSLDDITQLIQTKQNIKSNSQLIFSGVFVLIMQIGFSLLEAGSVGRNDVNHILFKNVLSILTGAISFWLIGFGVAYGGVDDNQFIGKTNFALNENNEESPGQFFLLWTFAATVITIVSGGLAERTKICVYLIYSVVLTVLIYPVIVHWIWDEEGLLSGKMIDFAGGGVVHMVGGISALWGAYYVQPRVNRFDSKEKKPLVIESFASHYVVNIPNYSDSLACLGVFFLWVGWYGLHLGRASTMPGSGKLMGKIATTTTLSAATSGVTAMFIQQIRHGYLDLFAILNGILAGLVGISAGCSVVEPWGAFLIGLFSAPILLGTSKFIKYLRIDDPLDAFAIHGSCGMWSVLAAGIFCTTKGATFGGYSRDQEIETGFQFGVQFIGLIVIFAWTSFFAVGLFWFLNYHNLMREEVRKKYPTPEVAQEAQVEGVEGQVEETLETKETKEKEKQVGDQKMDNRSSGTVTMSFPQKSQQLLTA